MSREIIYKFWDSYQKRMYAWDEIGEMNGKGYLSLWNSLIGQVAHITPLQFTGLFDKKGVEIYEGDILEYLDSCSDRAIINKEKTIGTVTWIQDRCALMPREIEENHKEGHYLAFWDFIEDIQKIGTIYENPELLK